MTALAERKRCAIKILGVGILTVCTNEKSEN